MAKAWPVEGIEPGGPLAENARRVIRVRTAELFSYAPAVANERAVAAHHEMRIAAKRLRYSLELFRQLLGEKGEAAIATVRDLQELLGALHDIDVRITLVAEQIGLCANDPSSDGHLSGLMALLERQRMARRTAYASFLAHWRQLSVLSFRDRLVALSVHPLPEQQDAIPRPERADADLAS